MDLRDNEAIIEYVQDGRKNDIPSFIIDDTEYDAERQSKEDLGEVDVYGAEGQCRNEDCKPGIDSLAQHFAFDCFAENQLFRYGANDNQRKQTQ